MRQDDGNAAAIGTGGNLSCSELVETITDYLEDAMSPEDRTRFESHLAICEGCRTYLEQMRDTIALTGRLNEESIPEPVRANLLAAFRNFRRG
jgi:anti-sigma factor RsiW